MKRWLTRLVVFVLLGVIVNVAVAWGCIMILLPEVTSKNERMLEGDEAASLVDSAFGTAVHANPAQCGGAEEWRLGWSRSVAEWSLNDHDPGIFLDVSTRSAGWPMYSVRGHFLWEIDHGWYEYALMLPDVLRPLGRRRLVEFLPLHPLWPGFAINTLFYAAILWLFGFGPFAARRFIRDKRGRCVECGYDLHGAEHEVCPECGCELHTGATA